MWGLGPCCPLTAALWLHPQKKKGKEAGSGASLPPPRVPALPAEARAPHTSSPASAKRSKAKAKGKEVKKEVRFPGGPGTAELLCLVDRWGRPCMAPPPPQDPCAAGSAPSARFVLPLAPRWDLAAPCATLHGSLTVTLGFRPGPSRRSLLLSSQSRGKGGAVSKLMESMAAEEDFEPNQDSSFSEDEHLPRGGAAERPPTPGEPLPCRVGPGLQCGGAGAFPGAAASGARAGQAGLAQRGGRVAGETACAEARG